MVSVKYTEKTALPEQSLQIRVRSHVTQICEDPSETYTETTVAILSRNLTDTAVYSTMANKN